MKSLGDTIDLSRLPPPRVVEELSFEEIRERHIKRFVKNMAEEGVTDYVLVESDPAVKVLEAAAYENLLLRQRVNDAVRECFLATARGSNLEHLTAASDVGRRLVAETPDGPQFETDASLRKRTLLAPDKKSTAGARELYEAYARDASPLVLDAHAFSPAEGEIEVRLLVQGGVDTSPEAVRGTVEEILSRPDVRPLTDKVRVELSERVSVSLSAKIHVGIGVSSSVVESEVRESFARFREENFRVARSVWRSNLFAALAVPSVDRVEILEPAEDVVLTDTQHASFQTVSIDVGTFSSEEGL